MFTSVPEDQKRNIVTFMEAIQQNGAVFDVSDETLMGIASQALVAKDPTELMTLIKKYCEVYRSRK